jgi:DNA transposition AAA+ family ATPase
MEDILDPFYGYLSKITIVNAEPMGSGKTTQALKLIKEHENTLWFDLDCTFSMEYAISLNIPTHKLTVICENEASKIFDIISDAIERDVVNLIVIDSYEDLDLRNTNPFDALRWLKDLTDLIRKSNARLLCNITTRPL